MVSKFRATVAAFACALFVACGSTPEGASQLADVGADGWRLPDVGTGGADAGTSGDAGPSDAFFPTDTSSTGDTTNDDGGDGDAGGTPDAGDLSDSGSGTEADTPDADTPDAGASDDGVAEDAATGDSGTSDAGLADGGPADGGVVFEETPVNVPSGFLCNIPDDYVANGGDPTYVPCDVEADRFTNRDPSVLPASLRIATWNIQFGIESVTIASELQQSAEISGADLLFLQEVARNDLSSVPPNINQARDLAALLSMNYVFAVEWDRRLNADEGGEHGVAILSKYPIGGVTQIRHVPLNDWYAEDNRYGGRMTLGADLYVGGILVRAYSAHLDTRPRFPNGDGRAQQGAEILADADLPSRPSRQIMGGDLNTWTCNPTISDCTKPPAAEKVIQNILAAGWSDGTEGYTGITQLGEGFFPQRLDWLFYRGAAAKAGDAARDAKGSDHFPVYFDLLLP
ncbi:MAG: hypothetical protein HY897_05080 [Deltaproteobacteria bacterium]|nr:hypothetical protein [Deltaproteobacteria bacterium]